MDNIGLERLTQTRRWRIYDDAAVIGREGRWRPPSVRLCLAQIDRDVVMDARDFMLENVRIASIAITPASAMSWDIKSDKDEIFFVVEPQQKVWLSARPSFAPEDLFLVDISDLFVETDGDALAA